MPAPTDITLSRNAVPEGAFGGFVIGTLAAADPDANESFTFQLLDDPSGAFEIVGDELRVGAGAALDFETAGSHAITVQVTDGQGNTCSRELAITVADLNEIVGTEAGETLAETAGDDLIQGNGGDDYLGRGGGGGGNGDDLLDGGAGNDGLDGGEDFYAQGADVLYGGEGNDGLTGGAGDSLYGGPGNDSLSGSDLQRLDGGEGDDFIVGVGYAETVLGGGGDDVIAVQRCPSSTARIDAGQGFDTLLFDRSFDGLGSLDLSQFAGFERIFVNLDFQDNTPPGTNLPLQLADATAAAGGTFEVDGSYAYAVAVDGSAETDARLRLIGSSTGSDSLTGGQMSDVLSGQGGSDALQGGGGDDELDGGEGNDEAVFAENRADYGIVQNGDGSVSVSYAGGNEDNREGTDRLVSVERLRFADGAFAVNAPPTDITVDGGTVTENAPEGTVVARLGVVDGDVGDTFTFAISDPWEFFEVVDREVRVRAGALVDYEIQTSHAVTLTVTDAAGASYQEELVIAVENVAGRLVVGDNQANALNGTPEEDRIEGRSGNDTLSGLDGPDLLFGEGGNDRLIGGPGADVLTGGAGNDTYVLTGAYDAWGFDSDNDRIVEAAGGGIDTVEVSWTPNGHYRLGDNLENLVVTGPDGMMLDGNELNNRLTGNVGGDFLIGGGGADVMAGGGGDDLYLVEDAGDRVVEAAGGGTDHILTTLATFNLSLNGMGNVENLEFDGVGAFVGTGNGLANTIYGGEGDGDDTLDGGGGADRLVGEGGDDTYVVAQAGDQVVEEEGEGTDTVRSSVTLTLAANLENLVLTGTGNINGTGNALANAITGNAGANRLDGGAGADALAGGAGNDTYVVDDEGDVITEAAGAGTDTVRTTLASFSLAGAGLAPIENLTFAGTSSFAGSGNGLANGLTGASGADVLSGGGGNDVLVGNDGADTLDGGAGEDTLRGGLGHDGYVVDSTLDQVLESAGQGQDGVTATVSLTLGNNLEDLTLVGAVNGTGNGLANRIVGSAQANAISGGGGNDALAGEGGDDVLAGGAGFDAFVFAPGLDRDRVTDFDHNAAGGGQDKLDVTAFGITAGTFTDRVTLTDRGADILVTIDDASQTILLVNAQTLDNVTQADFELGLLA